MTDPGFAVFWPGPDREAVARVASLTEAVELVERLHNSQGITGATVCALTEVPLTFRASYRVEGLGGPAVVPEVPGPVVAADPPAAVGSPPRSLGFFARD